MAKAYEDFTGNDSNAVSNIIAPGKQQGLDVCDGSLFPEHLSIAMRNENSVVFPAITSMALFPDIVEAGGSCDSSDARPSTITTTSNHFPSVHPGLSFCPK
eukprot:scaffold1697_cov120-Cylindrotheca_fusiformis.AAC.15